MERSVSPTTAAGSERESESKGFGVGSIFSFVKKIIPSSSHTSTTSPKATRTENESFFEEINNSDLQIVQNEPLLNDFTSIKKKRLSMQGHPKNEFIPRSSTLSNNKGLYKTYYDNLKTSKEELNNDVERRMSTVYSDNIVKDGVNFLSTQDYDSMSRNASPLPKLGQDTRNNSLVHEFRGTSSDTSESQYEGQNGEDLPLVLDHEYAPLYQDTEGNLVRPPFINIDPKERYQLLQLKKSIEVSQAIQNQIRYMIDPNETSTARAKNSNKVETATQTQDVDYLDAKLSFGSLKRKIDTSKDVRQNKRAKQGKGFFAGDFFYEVEEKDNSKSINKLNGYLGTVSKPKFAEKNTSSGGSFNEDDDKPYNTFGSHNTKGTQQRVGLDDSLLNNTKINVSLSNNYVKETESISNIIKLKNDSGAKSEAKGDSKPSSGFKFNINKDQMDSIINKRAEDNDLVANNGKQSATPIVLEPEPSKPLFGAKPSLLSDKPKFEFKPSQSATPKVSLLDKAPLPSDETKNSSDKPETPKTSNTPKFSFGGSTEPAKFSFGKKAETSESKPEEKAKETAPLFSSNSSGAPKFSFGKPSESESTKRKLEEPAGESKTTEVPKFSFGQTSKPSISFGTPKPTDSTDKPSFTFGKTTEKVADTSKSDDKPAETAKFSFGNSMIGNANAADDDDDDKPRKKIRAATDEAKPLFGSTDESSLFSKAPSTSSDTAKPAFSFGNNASSTAKPAFSFDKPAGKSETPPTTDKPSFSFGPKPTIDKPATDKPAADKPAFSFGSSASGTSKPLFGTATDKPALFSFDKSASSTAAPSTPVLFGKTDAASAENAAFGATENKPTIDVGNKSKPLFGATIEPKTDSKEPFSLSKSTTPKFNFGTTTTPTFGGTPPATTIGNANNTNNTTTPGQFSFSANPNFKLASGVPSMKPIFNQNGAQAPGGFSQSPSAFGQASAPAFSQSPAPAFGQAPPVQNSGFGQPASQGFGQAPAFGQPNSGGFTKESTPTFSFSNTSADPSSVFGQPKPPPTQGFNFGSREATPDPATIFGGGNLSMPQPNVAFGGGPTMPSGVPGQTPTPPLRRIAHPRNRRR